MRSTAFEVARELAAGPTTAYAANRKILYAAATTDLATALETERATQGVLGTTELHLEGMKAFLEKRKADFRFLPPR
jgi:2-(1,2-epoxy-1,2-dihydrophenyl)acetyl-CoA isomerase